MQILKQLSDLYKLSMNTILDSHIFAHQPDFFCMPFQLSKVAYSY